MKTGGRKKRFGGEVHGERFGRFERGDRVLRFAQEDSLEIEARAKAREGTRRERKARAGAEAEKRGHCRPGQAFSFLGDGPFQVEGDLELTAPKCTLLTFWCQELRFSLWVVGHAGHQGSILGCVRPRKRTMSLQLFSRVIALYQSVVQANSVSGETA